MIKAQPSRLFVVSSLFCALAALVGCDKHAETSTVVSFTQRTGSSAPTTGDPTSEPESTPLVAVTPSPKPTPAVAFSVTSPQDGSSYYADAYLAGTCDDGSSVKVDWDGGTRTLGCVNHIFTGTALPPSPRPAVMRLTFSYSSPRTGDSASAARSVKLDAAADLKPFSVTSPRDGSAYDGSVLMAGTCETGSQIRGTWEGGSAVMGCVNGKYSGTAVPASPHPQVLHVTLGYTSPSGTKENLARALPVVVPPPPPPPAPPALAGVFASSIFSGSRFIFDNVRNVATFIMFYGSGAQHTCAYSYVYNPANSLLAISLGTFPYGFCPASGTYQVGYNGGSFLIISNLRFVGSPEVPVMSVNFVRQ